MTTATVSWFAALGPLRISLFVFTLVNMAISIVDSQLLAAAPTSGQLSLWDIIAVYVTPVMAPLFVVVIFFDYVMSRVRAADAEGEVRVRYRAIARIELGFIVLSLLYWIPFLTKVMG